jgi:S-adenosylmethionine synthetase
MAKKVLVTGATGLLGRQVVKAFQRADWETVGIGFTRTPPEFLKVDLTSEDEIAKALDSIK